MVRSFVLRISTALAVALTAGAVLVATGSAATATQGQAVIAGQLNGATSVTTISNTGAGGGLNAFSVTGLALYAVANAATGVYGVGDPDGVHGVGVVNGVSGEVSNDDGSGVYGLNNGDGNGVYGKGGLYGIYGESATATGAAVLGNNTGTGNGVWGLVNNGSSGVVGENVGTGSGVAGTAPNGTGVLASSANGTALDVIGRSTFSTAGEAVIASGKKSVTVTLAGVTNSDFVIATVQGSGAFYVKSASAGSGKFTIYINKAPTAPATVTVAYFVISA